MTEPYYLICLFDPATPSFVSALKNYIGDRNALMRVSVNLAHEEPYEETADGIISYFNGRTDSTHCIAFQRIPVLRPVHLIEKTEVLVGERAWEHINVWGCPYRMRFDRAEVSQLLVEAEKSYQRFIRARFTGFAYMGLQDKWQPIGSFIFGNAAVLSIQNNADGSYSFSNILYVCEDASQSLSEQRRKMHDPDSLVFDRISEEVFGDG